MTTGNPIFRGCPSNKHSGTCGKLEVYDWLQDVQNTANKDEFVEIRFKNTRKDYYLNVNKLKLEIGDMVAVESNPGHDIGMVSMQGDLVMKQMKRHKVTLANGEMRKIYRKAKPVDIEKWEAAMKREHQTMIRSRQMTTELNLDMKIGDVEYQGDGTKAIFYYIADNRVDFRQLIKVLAENFRIRIEMKQIGARQEAGRIGGVGPCGRELCCCSWMSNFVSVSTISARYQEISLNPQKLAGQCSKLKCCINYEIDAYLDERRDFPDTTIKLETEAGNYVHIKTDVFKRTYWYTLDNHAPSGLIGVSVDRVKNIISMNKKGKKPEKIQTEDDFNAIQEAAKPEIENVVGQDSLTRFDKPKENRRPNKNRNTRNKKTRNPNPRQIQQTSTDTPAQSSEPKSEKRPNSNRPQNRPQNNKRNNRNTNRNTNRNKPASN